MRGASLAVYIMRRLVLSGLLVVGLLSGVFWLVKAMPGDAASLVTEHELDAGQRQAMRVRLGLDRPVGEQYLTWITGALRGDFGVSLRQQRGVGEIVGEAVGPTLLLTGTAFALELAVGVAAGVFMARHRGRRRERALNAVGLTLYSLPSFWLGLMAIMVFARGLGWFPAGGMRAPDAAFMSGSRRALDLLWHLVLPVAVLGLGNAAVTARFVRAGVSEILAQDFILAARARGLGERTILWGHALRAAWLPVVTLVGLQLPYLLGGAVVVEEIFGWPGMGRVSVEALHGRDTPVLMATTALAAVLVVLGNLAADLLYRVADPRVRSFAAGENA
jgi:peptide/nickel transport system permease protein